MAGLGAFLLAGAASGAGTGIVAEAQARRAEAIASIENLRLESREAKDREFRSGEAASARSFTAKEGALDRASADKRAALTDGTPASVKEAKWYQGATEAERAAFDRFRADPDKVKKGDRAKMISDQLDTLQEGNLLRDVPATKDELKREAIADVDEFLGETTAGAAPSTGTETEAPASTEKAAPPPRASDDEIILGKKPAPGGARQSEDAIVLGKKPAAPEFIRPAGVSDENVIKEAKAAIAKGADVAAIRSSLRTVGIDPDKAGI